MKYREQKLSDPALEQLIAKSLQYTEIEFLQWKEIALLMPIYQEDKKNACRVYYKDGSYDDVQNCCDTVRTHMAKMHSVNIKEAEKAARACEGYYRTRMVCVKLADQCTLVPLICRESERRNSGTLGYLVLECLYDCKRLKDNSTLIRFYETHKGIRIIQKYRSVQQQLLLATQLHTCYVREKLQREKQIAQQKKKKGQTHIGQHW